MKYLLGSPTSEVGQSLPGRASSKSGHFRYAPNQPRIGGGLPHLHVLKKILCRHRSTHHANLP